jgi:hypothetical protein
MEESTSPATARPQFLKVLCILTFIGSGVWTLWCLVGWWGISFLQKAIEQNGGDLEGIPGMDDPEKIEQTMIMMKYANVILSTGIAGCIICLIGALQMWNLKKMGFYIYAFGEIAPIIVSVVVFGSGAFIGMNLVGLIIPVAFLIMYGVNLKHLK